MGERRSIGAAMELTPEQKAFVQTGATGPKTTTPTKSTTEPQRETDLQISDKSADTTQHERRVRRSRSRRQAPGLLPSNNEGLLVVTNLLMQLTTRLHPTTYAALKRAGLEQKLYGRSPAMVQEIVEEAIQRWLRDYGYLD